MWETLWRHEKGAFPLSPELSSLEIALLLALYLPQACSISTPGLVGANRFPLFSLNKPMTELP